jgi:hypothetical protein
VSSTRPIVRPKTVSPVSIAAMKPLLTLLVL